MQVESTGVLGNFPQAFFVQLRFHDLPLAVFDERSPAAFTGDRNERSFRRADSYGEDSNACIRRFLRSLRSVAEKLFAVREDDHRSIANSALAEGLHGQLDRARDIGSAFGN